LVELEQDLAAKMQQLSVLEQQKLELHARNKALEVALRTSEFTLHVGQMEPSQSAASKLAAVAESLAMEQTLPTAAAATEAGMAGQDAGPRTAVAAAPAGAGAGAGAGMGAGAGPGAEAQAGAGAARPDLEGAVKLAHRMYRELVVELGGLLELFDATPPAGEACGVVQEARAGQKRRAGCSRMAAAEPGAAGLWPLLRRPLQAGTRW
jgi:hypothetical protein